MDILEITSKLSEKGFVREVEIRNKDTNDQRVFITLYNGNVVEIALDHLDDEDEEVQDFLLYTMWENYTQGDESNYVGSGDIELPEGEDWIAIIEDYLY